MIDAKTQARELVMKFNAPLSLNIDYNRAALASSIDCAIICVNEIISSAPSLPHDGGYYEIFSDRLYDVDEYWNKVKEEIQKLNTYYPDQL